MGDGGDASGGDVWKVGRRKRREVRGEACRALPCVFGMAMGSKIAVGVGVGGRVGRGEGSHVEVWCVEVVGRRRRMGREE